MHCTKVTCKDTKTPSLQSAVPKGGGSRICQLSSCVTPTSYRGVLGTGICRAVTILPCPKHYPLTC